ncbi:gamma-tubulin complex, DGRIP91/SPC98 component protein [Mycena belliarum]|uniref:Spindle pole body component n=1 Tax=Mycena belliarum TaxID=1033014 RepID=A0AAD6TX39_9AGAR|nr:gamma-tubulin complex, DGRIP91/SPC98 component protein [Mycena belliae]
MSFFPLPPFHSDLDQHTFDALLPEFRPRFFVPKMLEKPQNPIMDTLKLRSPAAPPPRLPTELASLAFDAPPQNFPKLTDSVWADAVKGGLARSEILSWDALRPNYPGRPPPNAFISEQENLVFAAARYYVRPRLNDPCTELKYIAQRELLGALKMTVLGIASPLHAWDPVSETFVQVVAEKGAHGILLVDDKDEVVSGSFVSRFLNIGTLLRRLEILLADLRSRYAKEGPTIHAFTHALSTVLSYLRETLADLQEDPPTTLTAIWAQYEPYEEVLVALSTLCCRDLPTPPRHYPPSEHAPIPLLSLLYEHLHAHLERQAPRAVTAILAFLLSSTSREYFAQLARSVGFGGDSRVVRRAGWVVGAHNDMYALDEPGEEDEGEERDELDGIGEAFPAFFPPALVDVLPAAQKSLVLLRVAEPGHPLLQTSLRGPIEWFWSWERIEAAWNGEDPTPAPEPGNHPGVELLPENEVDAPLAAVRVFDLEPGGHVGRTSLASAHVLPPTPIAALRDFIAAFPGALPPHAPTLPHLTALVLQPLRAHAATLSRALLALFMAPGHLQFKPHVELLHAYLLLGAPSFERRLAAALFSDAERDADEKEQASLRVRHKGGQKRDQVWPLGLSPALLERETWPPVGADLSFFLRTVIVDSFEVSGDGEERELPSGRDTFWVEAERRLGFAIRDLPTGPGHDHWLNPLSIEALDFLYMDYKAPHPLDLLITPDILSKYQRMFTYLLRIMRVEHALSSVFRMCRPAARPLFPTLSASQKLLLHLRFIAQAFVARLGHYVRNTAIGGNFRPFLGHLQMQVDLVHGGEHDEAQSAFLDVFALSRAHAALMDDVLSACLLRSAQRAAGDSLRQALELVLELAVLVGQRATGRLEEYEAAPLLSDLSKRFRGRMAHLTKALRALGEKGGESEVESVEQGRKLRGTGGIEAVAHLAESLSGWWAA